jgi:hypothetical protein
VYAVSNLLHGSTSFVVAKQSVKGDTHIRDSAKGMIEQGLDEQATLLCLERHRKRISEAT